MSANYTTAHGNAGSLTHWMRPGIEPASSWMLVRFINCCATTKTPLKMILMRFKCCSSYMTGLFLFKLDECEAACVNPNLYQTELFFFFFFFPCTCGIRKFLGQGSNLSHSSDNTGSLTHWATGELWSNSRTWCCWFCIGPEMRLLKNLQHCSKILLYLHFKKLFLFFAF